MSSIKIDRPTLAKFLPDNQSIVAFENMFASVEAALPDGIEAATALAYAASALANMAVAMLTEQAGQIEQLSFFPAVAPVVPDEEYRPAFSLGTLSQQNADSVEITGGTIDGTTIGATSASTGAFTTLSASGAVALSPAGANVVISPTGVGVVTISPATAGAIDKMVIGGTTPAAATVTTLNKITFTQPAVGATFTLSTGKTFTISNTLTMTATDGATLAIGAGGTLGSAAYTSSGTYALLAGSSSQAFATAALTASADSTINTVKIGTANTSNFYVDATNAAVRPFDSAAGAGVYIQNSAGTVTWSVTTVDGLKVTAGFGCNGATPQTAYTLGAAATDLASVITLANNLRAMSINNGTGQN